jgi:hypothetical protein
LFEGVDILVRMCLNMGMIEETVFEQVRSIMAEHGHCWGFVMIDEEGDFYCDATNPIVGEMVFSRALGEYKEADWGLLLGGRRGRGGRGVEEWVARRRRLS